MRSARTVPWKIPVKQQRDRPGSTLAEVMSCCVTVITWTNIDWSQVSGKPSISSFCSILLYVMKSRCRWSWSHQSHDNKERWGSYQVQLICEWPLDVEKVATSERILDTLSVFEDGLAAKYRKLQSSITRVVYLSMTPFICGIALWLRTMHFFFFWMSLIQWGRKNGRHVADKIFNSIALNENCLIFL